MLRQRLEVEAMPIPFETWAFLLSDDTLKAIVKDAERHIHDAPVTAEEVRYHTQRILDGRA